MSSHASSAAASPKEAAQGLLHGEREMESLPLVDGTTKLRWFERRRVLLFNFCLMAVAFSINHGCVTALLAVAAANLGDNLSSVQSGTLYVMYTVSALTVAPMMVKRTGSKWALAGGLWLYCTYVASFLVAHKVHSDHVKWYAACTGSTLGGFAAGWLWTAQGAYFARTTQLYSEAAGVPLTKATGLLGGVFATLYVGFEVCMKGLSSLLHQWGGDDFVFTVFTIAAVCSALGMTFVRAVPDRVEELEARTLRNPSDGDARALLNEARVEKQNEVFNHSFTHKVTAAMRLLASSTKMQLLGPMNMAFGFTAGMMNQFVNDDPAKAAVGKDNIGYLAAITPLVATMLSLPYAWLARRGKGPMMLFGALNYTAMAIVVMAMSEGALGRLGWGISFLYVIGGSGRAIFESTNKAVFADAFPDDKEAAFANVIVMSGGASAAAFFAIPHMSKLAVTAVTAGTGTVAMVCLVAFFRILSRERQAEAAEAARGGPVSVATDGGAAYRAPGEE